MKNFKIVFKRSITARVHDHVLWIRKRNPLIKLFHTWQNYHLADYNMFWVNIRENVDVRVNAHIRAHKK